VRRALVLAAGLAAALALLACGGSEQDKLERGLTVDQEQAAPESARELGETATERSQQLEEKEERREDQLFEESQQGD